MISYIVLALVIVLGKNVAAQDSLQTYSFSNRIGNEISAAERIYYGFFPKIDGFTYAKVFKSADEVLVKASYQLQGVSYDSVITWDIETVNSVRKYVENLGSMPVGEIQVDWPLIFRYVKPQHHRYELRKQITITNSEDDKYSGYLMTADNAYLSLWLADTGYNWRMLKDSSLVFSKSEIKEISIPKKGKSGGGFLIGILVGSGFGAAIGAILPFAEKKNIATSSLIFGAIGGVVGLIVGSSSDKGGTYTRDDARLYPLLMHESLFSLKPPPEIEEHMAKHLRRFID